MTPYYQRDGVTIHHGDCLDAMRAMDAGSVSAVVTDPPAGIGFMGKAWDGDKGGRDRWIEWLGGVAAECLRIARPGAHALVWALPRTSHRTATAWEDAAWEPRDRIVHLFGSGFPKSLDVSKAIDKAAGAEAAKEWLGWGTALKPAAEDWWLFRKPLDGTVAANVQKHGTGAINIDACRVSCSPEQLPTGDMKWDSGKSLCDSCARDAARPTKPEARATRACSATRLAEPTTNERAATSPVDTDRPDTGCSGGTRAGSTASNSSTDGSGKRPTDPSPTDTTSTTSTGTRATTGSKTCNACHAEITSDATVGCTSPANRNSPQGPSNSEHAEPARPLGRFPANVCHDGSDEVLEAFAAFGEKKAGVAVNRNRAPGTMSSWYGKWASPTGADVGFGDAGSAARFFYTAKASKADRGEGNGHPTVKPTALMEWLVKLVSPHGGAVLDPFLGSGTTGVACARLGVAFVGIEQNEAYCEIAARRLDAELDARASRLFA